VEEFESLNASSYILSVNEYEIEFKNLLLNIYSCYILIKTNNKKIPNNENKIRDILLQYLKDTKVRQRDCLIEGYRFDKEVHEKEGRVDIKIISINDFENHDAYYIIECKRLDGTKTLNDAYNNDGIKRFTTSYKSTTSKEPYYSTYYGINGMIGFVVKKIDIDANMNKIGDFFNSIEEGKLYSSTHDNLKLYHLMMDFSGLI
jgi:hypothetical protein